MRHRSKVKELSRKKEHRKSLLINQATSLLRHGRITTTLRKAKETRRFVERLISVAKKGDLSSKRYVARYIHDKEVFKNLFKDLVNKFKDREGGYTRIYRLGTRRGDGAEMAILELVQEEVKKEEETAG